MTITQSQSVQPASVCNIAVGNYLTDGTAAAITITVGFTARYVKVVNVAATGSQVEWFEGMGDAAGMKRVAAGDMTLLSSLGITVSGGTFIIGLDTDLNVTSEQLYWIALG